MKLHLQLAFGLLLGIVVPPLFAQEKIPVLKAGSETYSNITVTSFSETDVYFTYAKGMGNVKLKNLEPEMQRHFHYDFTKARLVEKLQQRNSSQFYRGASGAVEPLDLKNLPKDPKARMELVIDRVKEIVNQPVAPVSPEVDKTVASYPGWFHEGASKPDFNHADVRASRQLPYTSDYVKSKQDPSERYYRGSDLEFNSQTKYFYTDRSVPKKKLTEEEMVELNRLYRIIGRCEQELGIKE